MTQTKMHEWEVLEALLVEELVAFIEKVFWFLNPGTTYHHNWHIELLAHYLEKCEKGEIKRLVITLPPRNLKSLCVTVAFTAWLLGRHPELRIISTCYSDELSEMFGRQTLAVMQTRWYKRIFPKTRISQKKCSPREFETTRRGSRLATSMGGMLTGRGGSVFIIDDPIKAQAVFSDAVRKKTNELYENSIYTRLDSKVDGVIILIMQRLHVDDPVAHVLDRDDWFHINLPAIAEQDERFELDDGRVFTRRKGEALNPAHEPLESLLRTKHNIGTFKFSSQYQQAPVPAQGNMIRWEWFRPYDAPPPPAQRPRDHIVQSWDVAMTDHDGSDWSVCTTWATRGDDYYLLNVFRKRLQFPQLKSRVVELSNTYGANTVIIEDAGIGTGLIQQLRADRIPGQSVNPIAFKPVGSKQDRMAAQSAVIEAGQVLIPFSAPWIDEFRAELLAFPHGRHDDQVDSLGQFLASIESRKHRQVSSIEFLL